MIAAFAAYIVVGAVSSAPRADGAGAGMVHDAPDQCINTEAFALSLATDRGGQPTPVAAAAWFATHNGIGPLPQRGWHVVHESGRAATVRAGSNSLRVVQGSDSTWKVDSGTRCVG